jgi:hypothetical protein
MLGASRRGFIGLALAAAAIMAEDASARTIRRSCRDGLFAHRADRSGRPGMSCDVDGLCDGVCSFELPAYGTSPCEAGTLTVPVGKTRRERIDVEAGAAPTNLVLRCRPTPRLAHCLTVTTTTTAGPSTTHPVRPARPTTTTGVRLVGPGSTSSTTTISSSSIIPTSSTTSTSLIPCRTDANCDGLETACSVSFCSSGGTCVQTCVCLTTELDRTCSLDAAAPCLTPADCGDSDDGTCLVCYLNRCVTEPARACF